MDKRKTLATLTLSGETMVLIGAVSWSWLPQGAVYVFVVGTCLFFLGRMLDSTPNDNIVARRLVYQQKVGAMFLLIAAVAMISTPTWFLGFYLTKSTWFIPFLIFVIIEVYTTFRLAYIDNNQQK